MMTRLPLAPRSLQHLRAIRNFEAQTSVALFGESKDVLEVGAGDGFQSSLFSRCGHRVKAIDVKPSPNEKDYLAYAESRKNQCFEVQDYDGRVFPFSDSSFDIVYTSNVLEHIKDKKYMLNEMKRVLRDTGQMIHILPNRTWRMWSSATHFYRLFAMRHRLKPPARHGEIGNYISEMYFFSDYWWRREFKRSGLIIKSVTHNNLFYTGECIFDLRLSIKTRKLLSRALGSSCTIYQLEKVRQKSP